MNNNLNPKAKKKSEESLSHKVVRGGFWVFSIRIIGQIFNFVRLIILARILAPTDFGLMGIALLTMAALETFSQTGFSSALIQKKKNIKGYLNTVWTIQILRGIILFVVLYLIAPLAAGFFNAPLAKPIIQIIGFSILLHAFTNIGIIYFKKELQFDKQFKYEFFGILADFIVAVSAVLILKNVWALVFGLLAGGIVNLITSYKLQAYRPKFDFNLKKAKNLWGFGKWIFGSSILVFLITQGDDIFVGKMLGVATLGFYQLAYRISNIPSIEITHIISKVTFPAYSKLQENLPKLRNAYLKVLQFTTFLSFPIAGLIFVLAPDFTLIFLGEKWMPIVPAVQVLVFAGLIRAIGATIGPIFQAVGKPKIITKWQPIRLFVLIALIYPFTIQWGILGTSLAVLLSNLVSSIGFSVMVVKITKCGVRNFIKKIVLPLISTLIAILSIFILKNSLNIVGGLEFPLCIVVGILVYLIVTYILDKQTFLSIKEITLIWKRKGGER